jgi:phospho-N-acetylmuramoyl-pentapeptide-transferase
MNLNETTLIPQLGILGLFALGGLALSMILTPIYTYFAYKYQWWKKVKTEDMSGKAVPIFHKLHAAKHKRNVPTMAGIVIWGTVAIITLLFANNRAQTWLPLFTLVIMGVLGLVDDYLNIHSHGGIAGLRSGLKLFWSFMAALIGALWFYYKLGWNIIHVPGIGNFEIGMWYIPFFIFVVLATTNSVNITDGLDGLAGGLLIFSFGSFSIISLFVGQFWLAAFCLTIVGTLITYTWFNIPPLRFFMGDTGAIALGATLGVVAMLTNSALVLPIIGFVFVAETLSVIIQLTSKKLRHGKKVFLSAPIHHHFEAIGWPEYKVTMRFWLIGMVSAVIGVVIGILGRG